MEEPLTALLVAPDRALATQLTGSPEFRRCFQVLADLREYPAAQVLEMRLKQLQPRLLLVEVGSSTDRALEIIAQAVARGVQVIGLDREGNPDAILRSLRAGAAEFLHPPFDRDVIAQATARIRRLADPHPQMDHEPGQALVFASAKPGSGASMIAVQTAFALRRLTGARILLADLDLMDATVSFYLRLHPERSLLETLTETDDLRDWPELVEAVQGLEALGAPDFPSGESVEPPRLGEFLERARALYDWVILDLPSVFHRLSLLALSEANTAYVVSGPELPSLHLARKAVVLLGQLGFGPERFKILINRVQGQGGLRIADMAKIVNAPVDVNFPNEPFGLERALLSGEPLDGDSELGRAIESFAREIAARGAEKRRAEPPAVARRA